MIQEIKMPAAGQTTNKAVVCRICVKAGDNVKRGDVLLEAETDKAVLPVESFANGTVLAILVAEGDQVTAGTVLMAVGKSGEVYAPASGTAPTAPAPQEVPAQEQEEYLPIVRGELFTSGRLMRSIPPCPTPDGWPGNAALTSDGWTPPTDSSSPAGTWSAMCRRRRLRSRSMRCFP